LDRKLRHLPSVLEVQLFFDMGARWVSKDSAFDTKTATTFRTRRLGERPVDIARPNAKPDFIMLVWCNLGMLFFAL
jgi:hypothetical protein